MNDDNSIVSGSKIEEDLGANHIYLWKYSRYHQSSDGIDEIAEKWYCCSNGSDKDSIEVAARK